MKTQKVNADTKREKEQDTRNPAIEENFVIYNPDNPVYETLHLCKYLLELPDLEEEDPRRH
jgi:hypothetical protein